MPTANTSFKNNCATCHGPDGKGSPQSVIGSTRLSRLHGLSEPTPRAVGDWNSVVHRGGPIRGLDHHMPAFADALFRRPDRVGRQVPVNAL